LGFAEVVWLAGTEFVCDQRERRGDAQDGAKCF
jgi:hypothetical protein